MTTPIRKYILVDDDYIINTISSMSINKTVGEASIQAFTVPEEALAHIQNNYPNNVEPTILFLDINMPTMTGWEFMERYNDFNATIKTQITVYILSSSVDERDKDKAAAEENITGFICKPLSREIIRLLASGESFAHSDDRITTC